MARSGLEDNFPVRKKMVQKISIIQESLVKRSSIKISYRKTSRGSAMLQ